MTRRFKISGLCALAFILSMIAAESASAKLISCEFYNYSNRLVVSMYMSLPGEGKWGHDILTSSVVGNGEHYTFSYEDDFYSYARFVDIKMVCWDGGDLIFRNLDLKGLWRLSLFRKDSTTFSLQRN
ncbi:MAG: hypothetical protein IJG37_09100 [Synergistaceae bacterium]|nr:hypothetical protein [Synergistaceae bacterium]MBQ4432320.1 hypothetical protein [Synergistaceae bacterium]MBQ6972444.1 hypothetical protein [Synergistaceae bacterium]